MTEWAVPLEEAEQTHRLPSGSSVTRAPVNATAAERPRLPWPGLAINARLSLPYRYVEQKWQPW